MDCIQDKTCVFFVEHCQRKTHLSAHIVKRIIFYDSVFVQRHALDLFQIRKIFFRQLILLVQFVNFLEPLMKQFFE